MLILSIASPFIASTNPDGLESAFYRIYGASSAENPSVDQNAVAAADETVAERSGNTFSWAAPFSSYQIPGFDKPGEVLAIIIGIVVILLGAYGTMRFVNRQQ
ncbi:MAG: PDGLE domain-containing protein [Methanomicrobiales archaeon]|nr:PDGLE domain-containing protein [Methanomicrobiales archaeon]